MVGFLTLGQETRMVKLPGRRQTTRRQEQLDGKTADWMEKVGDAPY
jgi:hypothetical protein